ncbi:hypothetical protein ACFLTD_00490 [Elusimicrobiota bacterium]
MCYNGNSPCADCYFLLKEKIMPLMRSVVINLFMLISVVSVSLAHPPGEISMGFDMDKMVLNLQVMHKVKDARKHYIEYVKVYVGGELIILQNFKGQYNNEYHKAYFYMPDINSEEEIVVEAKCNFAGKLKQKITIQKQPVSKNPSD